MKVMSWVIKRTFIFLMVLALAFILNYRDANAAAGWSLIKDSNGIMVYERSVPGTELMEYMAVTTIDEKIEVIGEVLRDVPLYPQWLGDCSDAQVKKKYDRNTMVILLTLKPFMIEKRDLLLKDSTVYDWDNAKASISFQATDEIKIPAEKGHVRVTLMNGSFDMEFLGRDKTKFIYKLLVDPAGTIPKKVAYAVMKNYPYDTLKKLKEMIPNKKYNDLAKGTDEEIAIGTRIKEDSYVRKTMNNRLSKFIRDKEALKSIIYADKVIIPNIMNTGVSYKSVEHASTMFYLAYFEKITNDKGLVERLKKNKKMIQEMTDLVVYDCGVADITIDSIVEKYKK